MGLRVGLGYDVHKLAENRKLIMGGVEIPYELGLLGHSDADVLVHAIMDALVGAVKLGDIGKLFPDTDPQYKDISSLKLLGFVKDKVYEMGYSIVNIDSIIVAQAPKMRPYVDQMEKSKDGRKHCPGTASGCIQSQCKSHYRRRTWFYR